MTRIRRFTHDWVVRPWMIWVALGVALYAAHDVFASPTPAPSLQQIANDFRGLGHPVSCERDVSVWNQQFPRNGNAQVMGYTSFESKEIVLGPTACALAESGNSIGPLVFLHELYHSVGVRDEAQTECMALGNLYSFLRQYYGKSQEEAMQQVNDSWLWHTTTPPSYQAAWCKPPNFDPKPKVVTISSTVLKCYIRNPKTKKLVRIKCPS